MQLRIQQLLAVSIFFTMLTLAQNADVLHYQPADSKALQQGAHHLRHFTIFAENAPEYNKYVLKAIDSVQQHAMDGGTYFIGLKADPPESPLNYEAKLGSNSMLKPPRSSSYCSGSTYGAFLETLNLLFPAISDSLSADRLEALRMQEPDGGRREDWVKFWGVWNADGYGSQYALVQYANMGVDVKPEDARPGDFANISWKTGNGHSVIFLGWFLDAHNEKAMLYWSSQKGTNGYGDQLSPINKIAKVKFARLVNPGNIFHFSLDKEINRRVPGDTIPE